MYPTTKEDFSKLENSCVDPPIVKIKLNPEPTFPAGHLSFSCARGFPTETNQFCHSILKKSTKGCNVTRPVRLLLILKLSE